MLRPVDIAWTAALAAALYLLAWQIWPPLPYPSLGVVVGGLLVFWLRSARPAAVAGGAFAGLALGIATHAIQHAVQPRLAPAEGLALHLAKDAAFGLAVGGAVLAAAVGAYVVKARLASP